MALPEAESNDLPTDCVVPGWGAMAYDNKTSSDVLREVNVTVDTSLNCETPSKLCTTGPDGPFVVSELITHTGQKYSMYFENVITSVEMDYISHAHYRVTLEARLSAAELHSEWCPRAENKARHGPTTTLGLLTTATG